MSSFTRAAFYPLDDGIHWETANAFEFHVGGMPSLFIITVPQGEKTDFASIPRLAQVFIKKYGKHNVPAALHDYLYKSGIYSKVIADAIFYEAMLVKGVPRLEAELMYLAVHIAGFKAWNNYRKLDK